MKRIIIGAMGLGICALCFLAGRKSAEPGTAVVEKVLERNDVADPDVRVVEGNHGIRDVYIRNGDRVIIKYRFQPDMDFQGVMIYRLDEKGNAMSSKIFDRMKNELYKVSYGYRKSDGKLVEERVFAAKKKYVDAEGKELAVHRFVHRDDGVLWSIPQDVAKDESSIRLWVDAPFRNPFVN